MNSQALLCAILAVLVALGQSKDLLVRIEPNVRKFWAPEGSSYTFHCIVENHPVKSDKINWTSPSNGQIGDASIKMNSDATYTTTLPLTVENFTKNLAGKYECVITKQDGQQERASLEVETIVVTKPDAIFYFGNDTVLLYCETTLKDVVFKEWLKNNEALEKGEKYEVHANGSLSIMKLDRGDAGQYTARYDLTNEDNRTYDCVVNYKAGPLVLDMDKSINKDEGETVDIRCEVKGWPHPQITWLRNDKVLKQEADKITFSKQDGVLDAKLTLSDLQYESEGVYMCRAYSEEFNETNEKSIRLRVKDKLAWLYPFLGIIAQVIVLVVLIVLFEKFKKKDASHPHEQ